MLLTLRIECFYPLLQCFALLRLALQRRARARQTAFQIQHRGTQRGCAPLRLRLCYSKPLQGCLRLAQFPLVASTGALQLLARCRGHLHLLPQGEDLAIEVLHLGIMHFGLAVQLRGLQSFIFRALEYLLALSGQLR